MANLQLYTTANVFVNGAILAEEVGVRVRRSTGSQPVTTVAKGYAGESPGAGMIEIEVENAVPSADFELNPGPFMKNLTACEISLYGAGHTLSVRGFIVEDSFGHSVSNPSNLSFTFRGPFSDWG